ncbi:MAG: hypothetical protein Q7J73_07195 [Dehalococcoidales bacterium]|nr:hypothetical protein [Dehalococcoidales bacterium]
MNLSAMLTLVRRDLKDESSPYRWSDAELERHILHAVKDFSGEVPYEQKATVATTAGSREIPLSAITGRIRVEAVEYPVNQYTRIYQRYALWEDTLTVLDDEVPDGSNAYIYYGKLHTLGAASTIPDKFEDLIAAGACGYAAVEWAAYAINRVNTGGVTTPGDFLTWGNQKLDFFRGELKRLGRRNKVRIRQLYTP